jgi:hypothetical protein
MHSHPATGQVLHDSVATLADVDLSTPPTDGQVLKYSAATGT